ncbi:thioredoxin fold domain-containing protein [Cupriavidus gilardii]|uniref:thioredoxin fold domain-containing protein n=1 Tax=Cupriavidus gilardii TaxID=82541 RepID=UPI001EE59A2F|nr:thioredoxin fold domain-containing protein [Cupriavidus gilardii]MCG5259583.1 thioredoxin fold domain-containing protein [Cupriavidus gilardii]
MFLDFPARCVGAAWRRGAALVLLTGLLLALAAPSARSASAAHLPAVSDLAAETRAASQRGEPLVVLVSLPDCGYCEAVRRNYLGPQAAAGQIAARELDMSAATPIRDADGRATTARAWARAHGIRFAPTVLFLDGKGRPAAPPLRGMQPDFYGAYLEQSLDTARAAMAAGASAR